MTLGARGSLALGGGGALGHPSRFCSSLMHHVLAGHTLLDARSTRQDKWLEFAPTSPQRRASFVTEPKAVEGNPFDIYKEPEHNNDRLVPNTFYSAGTSYSVNERPVMISSEPDFGATRTSPPRPPAPPSVSSGEDGGCCSSRLILRLPP